MKQSQFVQVPRSEGYVTSGRSTHRWANLAHLCVDLPDCYKPLKVSLYSLILVSYLLVSKKTICQLHSTLVWYLYACKKTVQHSGNGVYTSMVCLAL